MSSLAAVLLACSANSGIVIPDDEELYRTEASACSEENTQFQFAPGVSEQTMDCRYVQWLEAARNQEIMFAYDDDATERVHFVTYYIQSLEIGPMGSGWFGRNGERLDFQEATQLRAGDRVTFMGGHGLDELLSQRGLMVGQEYTLGLPTIFAIAQPNLVIEEVELMKGDRLFFPTLYRSQFGLDFFYLR